MIELITVIILLGMVAMVGTNLLSDAFTTTSSVRSGNATLAEARYAVERLAREIREVKYATETESYCIDAATLKSFHFMRPVANSLDALSCADEVSNIAISASGSQLTLTVDGSSSILTDKLDSLGSNGFYYYKINSNGTTSVATAASEVRLVEIVLTFKDSVSGRVISQSAKVALKNGS